MLTHADSVPAPAPSSLVSEPSILASAYHYDAASGTLRAEGEVEASFPSAALGTSGELTLRCAALVLNLSEESLQAEGEIELTTPEFDLKGRDLRYELRSHSGSLVDAAGVVLAPVGATHASPLRLSAPKLLLEAGGLTLSQGRFTLCDAEKPHFWLEAGRLVISPGQRVMLSSGRVWLYGRKVLHFPKYSLSLGERGRLPVPVVGYNKGWGAFTGFAMPLFGGSGEIALSSKGGVVGKWAASGSVGARHAVPLQWEAGFARREDAQDPFNSSLLLDASPSLTLAGRVGSLGEIRATYARLTELPSEVRREKFEGRWVGPEKQIGQGKVTLTLKPQAWHNGYSGGEEYSVFALEAEARGRVGIGKGLSLAYVHNAVGGTTPFEYDDVDVRKELRPALDWRLGRRWAVGVGGRYDLERGEFADNLVRIDAIQHCLTYSLEWREARGQLNFSVGLSGTN